MAEKVRTISQLYKGTEASGASAAQELSESPQPEREQTEVSFKRDYFKPENPGDTATTEKTTEQSSDCEFLGELSSSSDSCLLEAISLFLEGFDPSQRHKNLKLTGSKVISLVANNSRFFVEEYFVRYLKLKLFAEDTNVSVISFMDEERAATPAFLALNDEYLLSQLRKEQQKIRKFSENKMPATGGDKSNPAEGTSEVFQEFQETFHNRNRG